MAWPSTPKLIHYDENRQRRAAKDRFPKYRNNTGTASWLVADSCGVRDSLPARRIGQVPELSK